MNPFREGEAQQRPAAPLQHADNSLGRNWLKSKNEFQMPRAPPMTFQMVQLAPAWQTFALLGVSLEVKVKRKGGGGKQNDEMQHHIPAMQHNAAISSHALTQCTSASIAFDFIY